ncbi:MAG: S9 family peptidase, partial [Sphingomonadales bacterium]|nr:S9 family peptidase [Sphingomonadales bacterium]
VFTVPADGGAPRQLTYGDHDHNGPLSWTSDGRRILLSANTSENWEEEQYESEIYALDARTGTTTRLTDREGPDVSPHASPDGRLIAYLGYDDRRLGNQNVLLYLMNPDGSGSRPLTQSLDRSIDAIRWAANSRAIYAQYDDRGETYVARVDLDGGIRTVTGGITGGGLDRPYTGGSFSVSDGGRLAITGGPAISPADIFLVDGNSRRQLTRLNEDVMAANRMGEVRRIEVASSHDGRPIEAWLTLPPGHVEGQRHPLILEIHGGPFAAYGPHFSTDNQLYAAAGYVVVSANPRGSTSYGEEFANLIDRAYPGQDYDDLISVVDGVIAQGLAIPEELFVTGGSGGGVLTSWIVGMTDRFRAAATQKPVINWVSQTLTSDIAAFVPRYWFDALPWEDHETYWRRSPLSLVGNVTTPTLVVVGAEDYRTPSSEAEQYYTALRLEGVPTAFVRVPGASHGGIAARPSQSAAKAAAIIAWFERYRENPWTPPAD